MITQSPDTSPDVEKIQISLLKNLTAAKKISKVRSLSQSTMTLSRRAIKRANPDLNEKELAIKIVACHYGEELADSLRDFLHKKSL
jgi:hypothetical protein